MPIYHILLYVIAFNSRLIKEQNEVKCNRRKGNLKGFEEYASE